MGTGTTLDADGVNSSLGILYPKLTRISFKRCTMAALGKEIAELKKIKDKWIWMFAGGNHFGDRDMPSNAAEQRH